MLKLKNNMKKIIALLFLAIVIISACEKDDFCTQNPVTPKLILRFYDTDNTETLKKVSGLYVWAEGVAKDSLFINASTDSLYIPLNINAEETIYNFSKGNIVNQFTIKYTPENEYVSRSCGFKILFNDVIFSADNTWITSFTQIETTIENQNAAHVQVFH